MANNQDLQQQVMMAARDYGISGILFRNALARKLGLNVTESMCMSLLGITGISTPSEIAQYTGLTTGSTTSLLDRLEKRKFITRTPNPKDRRGVLIKINEEYAKKAGKLVTGIQKTQKELIASYSNDELELITDFLNKFAENTRNEADNIENDLV